MKKSQPKININFNLSNKAVYLLIAFSVFILVIAGVYAFGEIPNPGHSILELQTCDYDGQILKMAGGTWACVEDVEPVSSNNEVDISNALNAGTVILKSEDISSPVSVGGWTQVIGWTMPSGGSINTYFSQRFTQPDNYCVVGWSEARILKNGVQVGYWKIERTRESTEIRNLDIQIETGDYISIEAKTAGDKYCPNSRTIIDDKRLRHNGDDNLVTLLWAD